MLPWVDRVKKDGLTTAKSLDVICLRAGYIFHVQTMLTRGTHNPEINAMTRIHIYSYSIECSCIHTEKLVFANAIRVYFGLAP